MKPQPFLLAAALALPALAQHETPPGAPEGVGGGQHAFRTVGVGLGRILLQHRQLGAQGQG